jgi:hypothetical protein
VELSCKLLSHLPYSPDLAPCDFFLFPKMKKLLGEKRFASNEEVITETEAYLAEFNLSYFLEERRWAKELSQLEEVVKETAIKTFAKVENHPNPLVRVAVDNDEDPPHRHKREKMALKAKLCSSVSFKALRMVNHLNTVF